MVFHFSRIQETTVVEYEILNKLHVHIFIAMSQETPINLKAKIYHISYLSFIALQTIIKILLQSPILERFVKIP
jgi:hypothetical protein